jgi:hypothetical protein
MHIDNKWRERLASRRQNCLRPLVRVADGVCFNRRSELSSSDSHADVAELVDALVSGTSGSNVVGVQVSPSALLS